MFKFQIFKGNNDSESSVENTLKYPIIARYIKFKALQYHRSITMGVDVIGCPYGKFTKYETNDNMKKMKMYYFSACVSCINMIINILFNEKQSNSLIGKKYISFLEKHNCAFLAAGVMASFFLISYRYRLSLNHDSSLHLQELFY